MSNFRKVFEITINQFIWWTNKNQMGYSKARVYLKVKLGGEANKVQIYLQNK